MIAKPKSRNRPLFMFAVGVILILAAADILWLHLVSQPPKTGDDGELSTRGRKELVLDQVWGIVFLSTGIALATSAFLIKPSPYAAVTGRGLLLRVGAPGTDQVFVPWEHISKIEAADVHDELGASPTLVIEVTQQGALPASPWRSQWHTPKRLLVDATGWDITPEELVAAAQPHIDAAQMDSAEIPEWSEVADEPPPMTPDPSASAAESRPSELDDWSPPNGSSPPP